MVDELKEVANYKAGDGTEFWVSVDEEGLHYITAKFPYLTGSSKYRNNFVQYIQTDIEDEPTAKGIAKFALSCYERSLSKPGESKYKVFLPTSYVGTYSLQELNIGDGTLGHGSIITVEGCRYLVGNVYISKDESIGLEVSRVGKPVE